MKILFGCLDSLSVPVPEGTLRDTSGQTKVPLFPRSCKDLELALLFSSSTENGRSLGICKAEDGAQA